MKKPLHPGVIVGVAIVAIAVIGYFALRIGASGPTEGNESTLPPQMQAAYGGRGGGGGSPANAAASPR